MRWVRVRAGGAGTSCWPPPVPGERSRGRAGDGRRAGRLVPRQTAAAAAPAALPAVWPAHLNYEKIYILNHSESIKILWATKIKPYITAST